MNLGLRLGLGGGVTNVAPGPVTYRTSITVPAASIISNLTGFQMAVNLADMPPIFWTHVKKTDGGDIRVRNAAGAELPFDIVYFAKGLQKGFLILRTDLSASSPTLVYIHYGDAALSLVPAGATNGRIACHVGFTRLHFLGGGDFIDRSGNGAAIEIVGASVSIPDQFALITTSANTLAHQGVSSDDFATSPQGDYVVFHTEWIARYNSAGTQIWRNNTPREDINPVATHLSPGFVKGDYVYCSAEQYIGVDNVLNQRCGRFNYSNGTFVDYFTPDQADDLSAQAYDPVNDRIVGVAFSDGGNASRIVTYSFAGVKGGDIALSAPITRMQGIAYWKGAYYVTSGNGNFVSKVSLSGTVVGKVLSLSSAGEIEGISPAGDGLLVLYDTDGNGNGVIQRYEPRLASGGAPAANFKGAASAGMAINGLTPLSIWTAQTLVNLSAVGTNRCVLGYGKRNPSSGVDSDAVSDRMLYRNTGTRFSHWNTTDSHLNDGSGLAPGTGAQHAVQIGTNGTTQRKIWKNNSVASSVPTVQKPSAGSDAIMIGFSSALATSEGLSGTIGPVALRSEYITDAWAAAWSLSWSTPSAFYSVGSEQIG